MFNTFFILICYLLKSSTKNNKKKVKFVAFVMFEHVLPCVQLIFNIHIQFIIVC